MMKKTLSLLFVIFTFTLIVVVHESGHFFACKLVGVPVQRFSIGFGPVLTSTVINNTEFAISLLPLGGYVSMDPNALMAQPYLIKMLIILAGISCNIIFALLLLIALFFIQRKKAIPTIAEVSPDSPAAHAGLQKGDTIMTLDGTQITKENMTALMRIIMQSMGTPINAVVMRHGNELQLTITPIEHPYLLENIGFIGVNFETEQQDLTLYEVVANAFSTAWQLIQQITEALLGLAKRDGSAQVSGPVGTINHSARMLQQGAATYLLLLANINIQIAIFNVLPIPFLDGGQMVAYTANSIAGQELSFSTIILISTLLLLGLLFLGNVMYQKPLKR